MDEQERKTLKTVVLSGKQIMLLHVLLDEHIREMERWKETKPSNTEDANKRIEMCLDIIKELRKES